MSRRSRARHARPRYTPTHARPSRAATHITTGTAALGVSTALLGAVPASAGDLSGALRALRQCESGGNYHINTHNGFYGAYQFDLPTWHALGYAGRPDEASPATQDEAVIRLHAQRGWQPWPACRAHLGLDAWGGGTPEAAPSRPAPVTLVTSASPQSLPQPHRRTHAPTVHPPTHLSPGGVGTIPPAFHGALEVGHEPARAVVSLWQAQMRARGWTIAVDGVYGPHSRAVAAAFQREKGLLAGRASAGVVNRVTWDACWVLPLQ